MFAHTIRYMVLSSTLAAILLATGCASTPRAGSATRDGVFVHIRSGPDQPHDFLMGMQMARLMAAERDVLVYFDVHAINAVVQDAPDFRMEPFGSSRDMIKDLLDHQVPLYACPGCLKALGKKPEQLLPGIKVADKQAFFTFTQGRILTIDY